MSDALPAGGVLLADRQPASALLHAVLADAVAAFPSALAAARLPDSAASFRATYPDATARFEAARAASSERFVIARHLAMAVQRRLVWEDEQGARPLEDALAAPAAPLPLESSTANGVPGWQPRVVYRGVRWEAQQLAELGAELTARRIVTEPAGDALAWVGAHVLDAGTLRMPGRKVVMLGAGAEMAPTRFWVEAGADVLWLDRVPPPANWLKAPGLAGRPA